LHLHVDWARLNAFERNRRGAVTPLLPGRLRRLAKDPRVVLLGELDSGRA